MIALRPYQQVLIDQTRRLLAQSHRKVIMQSATGSGKTRTSAHIVESAVRKGKRVLFIVSGRTLVKQALDSYTALGIDAAVLMAGNTYRTDAPVQVASVHTVYSRLAYLDWLEPNLIITDEAHEASKDSGMWAAIRARWPDAYEVGLTATPKPTDVYTAMARGPSCESLIAEGYLVRPRYFSVKESDSELLKLSGGDYTEASQAAAFEKLTLIGGVVKHWQTFAEGRPTVLFGPNVATSRRNAELFNEAGIPAFHIDAETPQDERQAAFAAVADGSLKVLCNYGVLGRGFDCPVISCVIVERETKSLTTWIQIVGRGLRSYLGKTDCVVIDLGENVHRFGCFVTDPPEWTLDGKRDPQVEREEKLEAKPRKDVTCSQCHLVYKAAARCPGCGFTPEARAVEWTQDERRDAELCEVTVKPTERHKLDSLERKVQVYSELLGLCVDKGWSKGAAFHSYRKLYGVGPSPAVQKESKPVSPSDDTREWRKREAQTYMRRKSYAERRRVETHSGAAHD